MMMMMMIMKMMMMIMKMMMMMMIMIVLFQDKRSVNYDELSGSDEDKGQHDAYLEKMKREGKQREEDDDEDDSSGLFH